MRNLLLFLREIPLLVWLTAVAGAYWLFGPEMRAARRLRRLRKKERAGWVRWRVDLETGKCRRVR